jgi:hypothetical protein
MTDQQPHEGLNDDQRARAAALGISRRALSARITSGLAASTDGAVDATDLLRVASWVVTGVDPWGLLDEDEDQAPTDQAPPADDPWAKPKTPPALAPIDGYCTCNGSTTPAKDCGISAHRRQAWAVSL